MQKKKKLLLKAVKLETVRVCVCWGRNPQIIQQRAPVTMQTQPNTAITL